MPDPSLLRLSEITLDDRIQSRAALDPAWVADLAEALSRRAKLPPVVVFRDGPVRYLAAGFHRYHAHAQAAKKTIEALVVPGAIEDAILFSAKSNTKGSLPRSHADKRRAVALVLHNHLAEGWSGRQIAAHCDVDEWLVRAVKRERECGSPAAPPQSQGCASQAEPEELADAQDRAERSARKLYRHLLTLAHLSGRPWREVLEEQIAGAERFEASKLERPKKAKRVKESA